VLKRSSWGWGLALAFSAAQAPLPMVSRGEAACGCTGAELALSHCSQTLGGTGSFRMDMAKRMQAHA